jgi:hypothetical protein
MPFVPIPRTPGWAITAARTQRGEILHLIAGGFQVLEVVGGLLAAATIGAAVLAALPSPTRRSGPESEP